MNSRTLLLCLVIGVSASSHSVAATPTANPGAKRTCDPSKVHHGPRGGKYTFTRDCKKVYQKRR